MKAKAIAVCLIASALLFGAGYANADTYPSRPIRIIVPYPAGDGTDVVARLVGAKISEILGQPAVIENRAGAGGQLGLKQAAAAQPDGYTLTLGQAATLALFPHTQKQALYDPLNDFVPVAALAANYLVITARRNSPFSTIAEMIAWAKNNPNTLTLGTTSNGGFQHMSMELLAQMAGFTFRNIAYKGMQQVITDLVGERLDVAIPPYTIVGPLVQSGDLKLLGITYPERDPQLPSLNTVGETVKGYGSVGWYGFLAPAGTPDAIVNQLNAAINQALKMPDVKQTMNKLGLIQIIESPAYFGQLIRDEHHKFGRLVKDIKFTPE